TAAGLPEDSLTFYQRAAKFGEEKEEADIDCQFEFPCIIQPLDVLLYLYDYWYGDEEEEYS
ncbi:hypothetical protein SK128_011832, partial [Halocaridina rubra]